MACQNIVPKLFLSNACNFEYKDLIDQIVDKLISRGFDLWFDQSGKLWTTEKENVLDEIKASSFAIFFFANKNLESDDYLVEFHYARSQEKTCMCIFLEYVEWEVWQRMTNMDISNLTVVYNPKTEVLKEKVDHFFKIILSVLGETCENGQNNNSIDAHNSSQIVNSQLIIPKMNCNCENHAFISYCTKNKNIVLKIAKKLQENFKIWIYNDELTGTVLNEKIARNISNSRLFICFISEAYCASDPCKDELSFAKQKKKELFPVFIDGHSSDLIDFLVCKLVRFNAYKAPDVFEPWSDELYYQFFKQISEKILKPCDKCKVTN